MAMTRRGLLNNLARLGGAAAVYEGLTAWNLLKPPPAMAAPQLAPGSGKGRRVAVLGAGVSGLCAAYELDRAGYDVTVLEANARAGGRSLTLRRGDRFREIGMPEQECRFDEGMWLNAGPGRIPHHHTHVIDYCRRFGVALQPYVFASRANLAYSATLGNGRAVQIRRALYDLQGHVAELLDKCVRRPELDQLVKPADLATFRDMLAQFGGLTKVQRDGTASYVYQSDFGRPGTADRDQAAAYVYRNDSGRAGYEIPPGLADQPGKPLSPMGLDELLRSNLWNNYIFRDNAYFWQTSLMEPVGGMDNFFRGFLRQPARAGGTIARLVRLNTRVSAIDVGAEKVRIAFQRGSSSETLTADFCVCTIPAPIFKDLKTNLPAAYMDAARKLPLEAAGKVGWQAERFWETKDQIYGGISWTTDPITQIWYPSSGYLSPKGVLTGAYMYGDPAVRFNAQPVAERPHQAREQGEKLHPGYAAAVEHGVAIGWNNMEFARMGWADEGDPNFGTYAQALAAPQGRFLMAGDQLTYWSGWQEGAIISAHAAIAAIGRQA